MNRVLKFRLPDSLDTRLEDAANRSARTRSDVARESLSLGLAALSKRTPTEDNTPPAGGMMVEETRFPVLRLAHAVQADARDLLTRKVLGHLLSEERVSAWMDDRGRLANSEISTPIDALALAHSLLPKGYHGATKGGDESLIEQVPGFQTRRI